MKVSDPENVAWLEKFFQKARSRRVPVSGMLEITSRCNLRCVHCYLGDQKEQHKKRALELSTQEVKTLIDQMVAAGTLNLLITGGDPMMRKDFPEIYEHAKRSGLLVTVFCDGVLVNEEIIELFERFPPRVVEISLYGATEEVYESITRVRGSHAKCIQGIERILAAGVPLALKTVMMKPNKHEIVAMREMAEGWGVPFRVDAAIFPCLSDRNQEPLDLRIDPTEAVAQELADPKARESWRQYHQRAQNVQLGDQLYHCGAGLTGFYVNPMGRASPCMMTTKHAYDVRSRSFGQVWREELGLLQQLRASPEYGCNSCEKRTLCTSCGGFNFLENGDEEAKSEYVCATTQARWDLLMGSHPKLPILS